MGLSNDGDNPVAHTQTWRPGARVPESHPDFLPLIVSGGAGIEAQFDIVGMRA